MLCYRSIELGGPIGSYSTVRQYEDDEVYVSVGGGSTIHGSYRVSSIHIKALDVYINGKGAFDEEVRAALKTEPASLHAVAMRYLLTHFAEKPEGFLALVRTAREQGFREGVASAKRELRDWLRI